MAVFSKLPSSLKFRMTGVVVMLVLSATLIVTLMACCWRSATCAA
jgi:hypothetical protein